MQKTITLLVHATHFPGRHWGDCHDLQVGWGMGKQTLNPMAADVTSATFTAELDAWARPDNTIDYRGPLIQGRPGARFLYLTWTSAAAPNVPIRRIKLHLPTGNWQDLRPSPWVVHLQMRDQTGAPLAASPKPPFLRWK